MSPGVPYVSVRSNDVLNGSLDLVLRLCTRVDTVWRVLRPGREVGIFLLDPLPMCTACCSTVEYYSRGHARPFMTSEYSCIPRHATDRSRRPHAFSERQRAQYHHSSIKQNLGTWAFQTTQVHEPQIHHSSSESSDSIRILVFRREAPPADASLPRSTTSTPPASLSSSSSSSDSSSIGASLWPALPAAFLPTANRPRVVRSRPPLRS